MKHLVVLTMIAVMGVPTLAAAADPAKPGAVCKEDRKKFCKELKTTGGKPRDCLMQHKDELSEGCKALLDKPKKGKGEGKGKGKKAKDGAAAPAGGAAPAAPAEGGAPAEGTTPPAGTTESAPQAEPEVPGEQK
ncbi:MAG TPA: cysteine rich repeat-containing protein [Methyloceanibacter sp.]|jgi:hypothetical protein